MSYDLLQGFYIANINLLLFLQQFWNDLVSFVDGNAEVQSHPRGGIQLAQTGNTSEYFLWDLPFSLGSAANQMFSINSDNNSNSIYWAVPKFELRIAQKHPLNYEFGTRILSKSIQWILVSKQMKTYSLLFVTVLNWNWYFTLSVQDCKSIFLPPIVLTDMQIK